MYGSGVLKGLGVTLKEFVSTYVDDIKKIPSRYAGGREEIDQTNAPAQTGLFTVQYPEEHRKLPERFRYIPMLVYEPETGEDRCTACGICAKVCPPQCIWIVRDKDEKGKPITRPAEFYIDASICMNCGLCAEFCPFDAIKMNHDFEIAAQQRMPAMVFDLKQLRVPATYYARIRPSDWGAEEEARKAKEAEKAAKPERGSGSVGERGSGSVGVQGSTKAEAVVAKPAAAAPTAAAPAVEAAPAPAAAKRTPEEIERMKAEAAARRAAKAVEGGEAGSSKLEAGALAFVVPPVTEAAPAPVAAAPAEAAPAAPAKRTPEEIERLKAEAAARRAAKAGGEAGSSKLEAETATLPPAAAEPIAPAPVAEAAPAGGGARRTPEEIERLKAEAAARRAAKAAGQEQK